MNHQIFERKLRSRVPLGARLLEYRSHTSAAVAACAREHEPHCLLRARGGGGVGRRGLSFQEGPGNQPHPPPQRRRRRGFKCRRSDTVPPVGRAHTPARKVLVPCLVGIVQQNLERAQLTVGACHFAKRPAAFLLRRRRDLGARAGARARECGSVCVETHTHTHKRARARVCAATRRHPGRLSVRPATSQISSEVRRPPEFKHISKGRRRN